MYNKIIILYYIVLYMPTLLTLSIQSFTVTLIQHCCFGFIAHHLLRLTLIHSYLYCTSNFFKADYPGIMHFIRHTLMRVNILCLKFQSKKQTQTTRKFNRLIVFISRKFS